MLKHCVHGGPSECGRTFGPIAILERCFGGLLLTTQVVIADAPQDEAEHAYMPPGGDMGDMKQVSDSAYLFIDRYESPVRKLAGFSIN